MKECERITDLFGRLHDDEADGEIGELVRDHLYNCPGCREEYKWYTLTIQALGSLETVSAPQNFVTQLSSKLYSEPSRPFLDFFRNLFSNSPYMPLPVGVVSLFAVVVIGLTVYHTQPIVAPSAPSVTHEQPVQAGVIAPGKLGGIVAANTPSQPLSPSDAFPILPGQTSKAPFPTIAELIGADNLTVESPSVDKALASLQRILPNIQGQQLLEKRDNKGEVVLAVLIPSDSYGHLTTELVQHGAVAAGVDPKKDGNNVLLYIRFVGSR